MVKMISSKYDYEPPEWVRVDARLDKRLKNRRLANKQGVFNLENKSDLSDKHLHDTRI